MEETKLCPRCERISRIQNLMSTMEVSSYHKQLE